MANVYILQFKDEPEKKYCYSSLGALYLAHGKEKLIVNKQAISRKLNNVGFYKKRSIFIEKHPLFSLIDVQNHLERSQNT